MLKISQSEYEAIRRHGEETYPHECCGVLLGRADDDGRVVTKTVRCGNTRSDSPHNRYHISPQELVRVQRPARWSQTDLAEAHWIGCSYVITSVERGQAKVTNSFLLTGEIEENKRFEDEEVSFTAEAIASAKESLH